MKPECKAALLACVFIRWFATHVTADGLYDDDPDVLMSKRFLRFGRSMSAMRSMLGLGAMDPYEDVGGKGKRGGGFYKPFFHSDKRFLRFGKRASEPTIDDYARAIAFLEDSADSEPLYRKRRSLNSEHESGQEHLAHRRKRSAETDEGSSLADAEIDLQQNVQKRDLGDIDKDKRFMRFGRDPDKRFMRFGRDPDKRFMRFGKRFMRFGKSVDATNAEDETEEDTADDEDIDDDEEKRLHFGKRFMRFGKRADGDDEKRFMRFGKRFMRFGKSAPDSDGDVNKRFMRFGKRFMRFGKSVDPSSPEKRFMRFGKSDPLVEEDMDKRFMRFGKSDPLVDEDMDKRFMRFGKSVSLGSDDEDVEKRFMRFGKSVGDAVGDDQMDKRFMRFGKSLEQGGDVDKRFMRFGKRFMRFGRDSGDKRFMRFGRSVDSHLGELSHSSTGDGLSQTATS